MTVAHIKLARAIWLVDSRDLNPNGVDIMPMLDAVRTRYNFQVYPKTVEEANEYDAKGIVFMNGSFAAEAGGRYTIVKATIFNDGLVVDSARSSTFCDAFLEDVLTFLSQQFGLTYNAGMIHSRLYVSELIVRMDRSISTIFERIAPVIAKLNRFNGNDFQAAGFGFSRDPEGTRVRPAPFSFEREVGKPFSQNRYYSGAPLRTEQHEEILRDLEGLL